MSRDAPFPHHVPRLGLEGSDRPRGRAFASALLGPIAGEAVAAGARIAGYLVTESVPLAPPVQPAGARGDGFAQISMLRRPASLDRDAWLENWQGRHTAVAIETQSTFGYVQNAVVRAVTPDAPPTDAVVEELFPIAALSDPYAFYDVAAGDKAALRQRVRTMLDSVATFGGQEGIDAVPTSRYVTLSPFVGD